MSAGIFTNCRRGQIAKILYYRQFIPPDELLLIVCAQRYIFGELLKSPTSPPLLGAGLFQSIVD